MNEQHHRITKSCDNTILIGRNYCPSPSNGTLGAPIGQCAIKDTLIRESQGETQGI